MTIHTSLQKWNKIWEKQIKCVKKVVWNECIMNWVADLYLRTYLTDLLLLNQVQEEEEEEF